MLGRITLLLVLAAITAVVIALGAGGAPAASKTKTLSSDPIQCEPNKVCKGTSGNDLIIGTTGADDINPFGGNDVVYADPPADLLLDPLNIPKGGDDYVHHSYGDDTIYGGPGEDTLRGGFGHDTIYDDTKDDQGNPVHDGAHDLIDCAYLGTRGDSGPDEGFGEEQPTDTVVDCSNRDDQ